jgi:V/A-type H+-transporting ATPase subunit D
MSAGERLAPTRLALLRARRDLARVRKGAELLRRKREALVGELFRLARPAVDARATIATHVTEAAPVLMAALAEHGRSGLRAMSWPERALTVELRPGVVWGIPVSDIVEKPPVRRTLDARDLVPGSTGPTAADAALRFEMLADLLLDAAPREQRIRRLGEALARTTRQLRTLEQRLAPQLVERIGRVRGMLEEREREEHLRLKHVQRKR